MLYVVAVLGGIGFGVCPVLDRTLTEITERPDPLIPLRSRWHLWYLILMGLGALAGLGAGIYFFTQAGEGIFPAMALMVVTALAAYLVGTKLDERIKRNYALRGVKP